MMKNVIEIKEHERGVLVEDGVAVRALDVGREVVWALWKKIEVVRYDTRALVAELPGKHAALLARWLIVVNVGERERAIVWLRGRPLRWLGAGVHLVWNVEQLGGVSAVRVELVDAAAVEAAVLREDVRALVPANDYAEVTGPESSVALRVVNGAVDAVLGAGRHAAWAVRRKVAWIVVEMRERALAITGQEVMTKDKVTLRINAALVVQTSDAKAMQLASLNADEALYLAAQLQLREAVAGHTLEELLARRELLVDECLPALVRRGAALGVRVHALAVKDLILPGEMKALMNRVIEAQKAAEASVILRREETNATRNLAQTAKVLSENPLMLRLKELEAYKELAEKVGTVNLVLGDGALGKLELKT